MSKTTNEILPPKPEALFGRVVSILEYAHGNVLRAVNTHMVLAYWLIGREIVDAVQGGEERAEYGRQVLETSSRALAERYGKGFSVTNLKYFRLFYQAFPGRLAIRHPAGDESVVPSIEDAPSMKSYPAGSESVHGFSPQISWSHYRALMRVDSSEAHP